LEEFRDYAAIHYPDSVSFVESFSLMVKDKLVTASVESAIANGRALAESLSGTPLPYSWENPHPVVTPTPKTLPEEMEKTHIISPDMLNRYRKTLGNLILSGIARGPKRDGYRLQSNGCGLELLRILFRVADSIGITEAGAIETAMSKQFAEGLSSVSVAAFTKFRETYQASNNAKPTADRLTDAALTTKYKLLVDRLNLDQALTMEIMRLSATSHAEIVLCIENVLSKEDSKRRAVESTFALVTTGRADAAADPAPRRRSPAPERRAQGACPRRPQPPQRRLRPGEVVAVPALRRLALEQRLHKEAGGEAGGGVAQGREAKSQGPRQGGGRVAQQRQRQRRQRRRAARLPRRLERRRRRPRRRGQR
jgi:hypothetical protein